MAAAARVPRLCGGLRGRACRSRRRRRALRAGAAGAGRCEAHPDRPFSAPVTGDKTLTPVCDAIRSATGGCHRRERRHCRYRDHCRIVRGGPRGRARAGGVAAAADAEAARRVRLRVARIRPTASRPADAAALSGARRRGAGVSLLRLGRRAHSHLRARIVVSRRRLPRASRPSSAAVEPPGSCCRTSPGFAAATSTTSASSRTISST